ncbi:MAG: hypothetical protein HC915_17360 [Anaerolineae bacterium]|nr:hypothetical protein [Anaerolineae bacterium]
MRRLTLFLCLLLGCLLALDAIPALRGGWGWQWPYDPTPLNGRFALLVALMGGYLLGVVLSRRRGVALQLAWAVLGGVALSLGAVNLRGAPDELLFQRVVSPVYTGSNAAAVRNMSRVGLAESLQEWPVLMDELAEGGNIHVALSPPGQPLVYYGLAQAATPLGPLTGALDARLRPLQCTDEEVMRYTRAEMTSTLFGLLMPLWAALTVFPLFAGARLLGADQASAARLAQWWPLVPAGLFFTPSWNTLYPLLVTGSFAVLVLGLTRRQMRYVLLAGLLMSVATFLNFSVVPALMLMGWYTLGYWFFIARRGAPAPPFAWTVQVGVWFGAGLSACWVAFWLFSGHTPWAILQAAFDQHLSIERDYWVWLVLHPYDMALFAGWGVVGAGRSRGLAGAWQTAARRGPAPGGGARACAGPDLAHPDAE